jgi:hypothetical protein
MHRSRSSERCTVWKFEILTDLSLFPSPKYNEFKISFLHTSRSYNYLSQDILFWIFWNFQTLFSTFFKKKWATRSLSSICPLSLKIMLLCRRVQLGRSWFFYGSRAWRFQVRGATIHAEWLHGVACKLWITGYFLPWLCKLMGNCSSGNEGKLEWLQPGRCHNFHQRILWSITATCTLLLLLVMTRSSCGLWLVDRSNVWSSNVNKVSC